MKIPIIANAAPELTPETLVKLDKVMKDLGRKIKQAQNKLDDAVDEYDRNKGYLKSEGLWEAYCKRVGATPSHTGNDLR